MLTGGKSMPELFWNSCVTGVRFSATCDAPINPASKEARKLRILKSKNQTYTRLMILSLFYARSNSARYALETPL